MNENEKKENEKENENENETKSNIDQLLELASSPMVMDMINTVIKKIDETHRGIQILLENQKVLYKMLSVLTKDMNTVKDMSIINEKRH